MTPPWLRSASPPPLQGATLAARRSRFRGVPGLARLRCARVTFFTYYQPLPTPFDATRASRRSGMRAIEK